MRCVLRRVRGCVPRLGEVNRKTGSLPIFDDVLTIFSV
jgi:glutamate-1-semialdehyde aminotransferase